MSDYALILTGGTIGSSKRNGILSADAGTDSLLLKKYREQGGKFEFDAIRADNLLSENYSEEAMFGIASAIAGAAFEGYRAAAVAAGTDNLGNLAAFLAFALAGLDLPVFLISSQFPLSDVRENGSDNLRAVDAAVGCCKRGVFVLNRNLTENSVSVHAAARMFQCGAPGGDFRSAGGALGSITDGKFAKNEPVFGAFTERFRNPPASARCFRAVGKLGRILALRVTPFGAPKIPDEPFDAAFLELYHSGTAPVSGGASVLPFLDECAARGIPVYAAPAYLGAARYETAAELERRGMRFVRGAPALAAETKLRFLYGESFPPDAREYALSENVAGEMLPPDPDFGKI